MKTDRKSIILMGTVLIACMCVCMATKEGLEEAGDACDWIVLKDETNTKNCDACPSGDSLIMKPGEGILAGFNKYTCGKAA
tara:strand:+ start:1217 stop:1459 length:243 start_codon:yes stop_codon:yes gene_type:complete